MPRILYISEEFPSLDSFPGIDRDDVDLLASGAVPTTQQVLDAELVLILGSLGDAGRARQISGVFRLTVESGTTVVLAYPDSLRQEGTILQALAPHARSDLPESQGVEASHPAFREYLSIFGRSAAVFDVLPDDAEVLGRLQEHSSHPPAAWCSPVGAGAVYVIPFYLAGAAEFLPQLIQAVRTHRSGASGQVPAFLEDLRLATEREILTEIDRVESELKSLRKEAAALSRSRLLVGPLSGDALEQLVIEALNVALDATTHRAEDREDLRAEDFWIVDAEGDRALAEAKGIGRHVRREDVNQVDNHRAELERRVEELPGSLVANVFRGDESRDRRVLPVNEDVIRHAVRQNVLILRGIDLYQLVSQKLGGRDVGNDLVNALYSGGGWLAVDEETIEVRKE